MHFVKRLSNYTKYDPNISYHCFNLYPFVIINVYKVYMGLGYLGQGQPISGQAHKEEA